MSRPPLLSARLSAAGAASLAALSLLVTSLTPLAPRASAADESTQSPDVATTQEAVTASSGSENAAAPADDAGDENSAVDSGTEASGTEIAPEDQPRTRRARAVEDDSATLAMTVVNDEETLPIRGTQTTTINFSCSSVTTPCRGGVIEVIVGAPVTPAGVEVMSNTYDGVRTPGNTVVTTEESWLPGSSVVRRYVYTLKDEIPAGTSDRVQLTWKYRGNDVPDGSVTTQTVSFKARNASTVEQSLKTTWTASTAIAIVKTGPTDSTRYPALGGEVTYKLQYGYQGNIASRPDLPGQGWLRPEGNGVGFVTVQDIKVVDPLPAQAIFLSASDGGVYDAASHSVTWQYPSWSLQNTITSTVTVKYPEGTFNIGDTVTNTATITAAVKNDPETKLSKTAEFTHGFGKSFPRGSIDKGHVLIRTRRVVKVIFGFTGQATTVTQSFTIAGKT